MTETRSQTRDDGDDWTQISNKVVRKRVQNRLAQRNYRKGIKARLKELERLASRETSPPSATNTTQQSPNTPAHNSSPAAKEQPAGSSSDMPNLAAMDISMPGVAFPSDGSAASFMYPSHPQPVPAYTAVNGSLSMGPNMPVMRDQPFPNAFAVPDWAGDGNLSPNANFLAPGYATPQSMVSGTNPAGYQDLPGDMDSLGNYLNQHRQSIDCHDMQPYAKSSASAGDSSDRPSQATDLTSGPDRIMPCDSVSSHETDVSTGAVSSRTPVSQNGCAMSSRSLSTNRDRPAEASAGLSSRIASAMATIRELGFSGIEDLTAQFYTADLQERPALADAQRISRRRGLTRILAKLREHSKDDWTDWEAQGYREEIVRAAEDILGDECRRFSEDDEARGGGGKKRQSAVEMKRQFQEELPNLYGLLGVLSLSSQQWGDADHSAAIVHAIDSLLRGSECAEQRETTKQL